MRAQVEFDRLRRAGHVVDAEHEIILEPTQMGEDAGVRRLDRLVGPEPENGVLLAQQDEAVHPAQEARGGPQLSLDVHCLKPVNGVHQRWGVELSEVGPREPAVAVPGPLHGRAHAIAVAQEYVVAHGDLVTVVQDGRARQRE